MYMAQVCFYVCCMNVYVCVRGVMDVVVSVCRRSCMGSMSVSSCRCCMFVSYVHPVAVLNTAFWNDSSLSSQVSHAYRKIDITRERIRMAFDPIVMLRSLSTVFRLDNAAVA